MRNIRRCAASDFPVILAIINAAAQRYRGVIPDDRWHEPYMPEDQLRSEIRSGVEFWAVEEQERVTGIMGIQPVKDVVLIRHAYVLPGEQGKGVGSALLRHLRTLTDTPILIGTWADASWAIGFYQRHGFTLVPRAEVPELLRTYWNIPERQVETSVVLADERYRSRHPG
jgi:N-acetylglutamate synthase-like GNAT family acetyltransferase